MMLRILILISFLRDQIVFCAADATYAVFVRGGSFHRRHALRGSVRSSRTHDVPIKTGGRVRGYARVACEGGPHHSGAALPL